MRLRPFLPRHRDKSLIREVAIAQVIKRRIQDTLTIERRIAQGCAELVERLNATFRQRLACLVRRGRALARQVETLEAGMFLLGCVYNFCTHHQSLRLKLWISERRFHWVQRTPAVAAGLTDHRWSVQELLLFKLPLSPFVSPKHRGSPPKQALVVVTS